MSFGELHYRTRRRSPTSNDLQNPQLTIANKDDRKKIRKVSRTKFLSLCIVVALYFGVSVVDLVLLPPQLDSSDNSYGVSRNETQTHKDKLSNSQEEEYKLHKIPRVLLFTHYRNLLADAKDLIDEEEQVLSANIRHAINLHPSDKTVVRFLTDDDCIQSLENVFPSLIPFFLNETVGMYKADICRGSALYETGGIYLDVDLGVRKDLWQDLLPTTEFVTSFVHRQSKYPHHFFQAVLGAAPRSKILYKYLQLFKDHYTHKYPIKGPLGVILLRNAWDATYNDTADSPATELYQEVLYHKKLFPNLHPAPTWGVRRACHFIVVARAHSSKNAEMKLENGKLYHIPFYSRIAGSRMCPKQNTTS